MGLFDLPNLPSTKDSDKSILNKTSKRVKQPVFKGGGTLLDKINQITKEVESKLGDYKDRYKCIRTEEELITYIDKCIENNIFIRIFNINS